MISLHVSVDGLSDIGHLRNRRGDDTRPEGLQNVRVHTSYFIPESDGPKEGGQSKCFDVFPLDLSPRALSLAIREAPPFGHDKPTVVPIEPFPPER